jgi:host factor-I protein
MNEQPGVEMVNRKLFRTSLTEVKEQYPPQRERASGNSRSGQQSGGGQPRKKPAPPEQTAAESFYYVKQMQSRTPVAVVLTDGETLRGTVEWYDKDCIKLTRFGSPNLLIYKHCIKYLYKDGDEASHGGNGNGHQ